MSHTISGLVIQVSGFLSISRSLGVSCSWLVMYWGLRRRCPDVILYNVDLPGMYELLHPNPCDTIAAIKRTKDNMPCLEINKIERDCQGFYTCLVHIL